MFVSSGNGYAVRGNTKKMSTSETSQKTTSVRVHCRRCTRCGSELKTVFVHGHEQCVACNSVVMDCCQGDICA